MKNILYLFVISSFVYSQCSEMNQNSCTDTNTCEWVESFQNMSCGNYDNSQTSCQEYSQYGCSWEFAWGGWQNYGSYCAGGTFQIDNSYCEEVQMPECSEMNNNQCVSDMNCNWMEDIDSGYCSDFNYNSASCNSIDQCSWTSYQINCGTGTGYSDCVSQAGCSYSWLTYQCSGLTTITDCSGGYYQIDNGYCEETENQIGDLNQDGNINIQDVIISVSLILDGEYNYIADINNDGTTNVIDIILLIDIILDV